LVPITISSFYKLPNHRLTEQYAPIVRFRQTQVLWSIKKYHGKINAQLPGIECHQEPRQLFPRLIGFCQFFNTRIYFGRKMPGEFAEVFDQYLSLRKLDAGIFL
jgi:hypothetical protein